MVERREKGRGEGGFDGPAPGGSWEEDGVDIVEEGVGRSRGVGGRRGEEGCTSGWIFESNFSSSELEGGEVARELM